MMRKETTVYCRAFHYVQKCFVIILLFLVSKTTMEAQPQSTAIDSTHHELPTVVVDGLGGSAPVRTLNRGRVVWHMSALNRLPQIMGNSDPLRYAQTLPGIQTNNEYDSGLHIYGCDNSHNILTIADVPIYNANHLLGLFSTFNPSHYQQMSINKCATDASFSNRLGGQIELSLEQTPVDTVGGEFTIGLISSQGTIRIPIGHNSSLTLSGRLSYLNLLYGYALKNDGMRLHYSFADGNATWLWNPDSCNKVWVDAYWGATEPKCVKTDILLKWACSGAMLWYLRTGTTSLMPLHAYATPFTSAVTIIHSHLIIPFLHFLFLHQ